LKMPQKSITSFFKNSQNANTKKRSMGDDSEKILEGTKKAKTGKENELESEAAAAVDPEVEAAVAAQVARTPLLDANIGRSWFLALREEFEKPYFAELSTYIEAERKRGPVHPSAKDVFSWTRHTKLNDVKVVILGQDPYHGPGQAHGLSFSVLPGVAQPPSLRNMLKEVAADVGGKTPGHGCLRGWAEQGVLLLNTVLTVRQANANSHRASGWETFTSAVLRAVCAANKGVVLLLWGKHAQDKLADIDTSLHHPLTSVHPSPLSAHRGFLGCRHFSKCNELLLKEGKTPIDWGQLPVPEY